MQTPQQPYDNAHPHFPYPASHYPTLGHYASPPPVHTQQCPSQLPSGYPHYLYHAALGSQSAAPSQAASSSLACALVERASAGFANLPPAQGFPGSEVVPYSPSPSSSAYESASPAESYTVDTDEDGSDNTIRPHGAPSDVMRDQPAVARSHHDAQMSPSTSYGSVLDPSSPVDSPGLEPDTEIGYFNGHRVPLGLVTEDYASDDYFMGSPIATHDQYHVPEHSAPSSLAVFTQAAYPSNSRSYTLAGAIKPKEEQRQRPNRPQNKIPDATPVPTSSIDVNAGMRPSPWQPDSMDGRPDHPDHASSTSSASPSPPPSLPTPGPPRAKSPVKAQPGSTRPGPSGKTKMASPAAAKLVDEIQTEPTGRPGESVIKLAVNVPREPKRKPIMACLFCRERKIACGHASPTELDRRCNQCRRRDLDCVFPTECRRGQHKRISRLARVNAALNNEGAPLDERVGGPQAKTPRVPSCSTPPGPSTTTTTTGAQIAGPSDARERQKRPGTASSSKPDADAEQRALARLQRQMASMSQQRLSQR